MGPRADLQNELQNGFKDGHSIILPGIYRGHWLAVIMVLMGGKGRREKKSELDRNLEINPNVLWFRIFSSLLTRLHVWVFVMLNKCSKFSACFQSVLT